jgi:hypothetical protein
MSLALRLRFDTGAGPVEALCGPVEIIAWERRYKTTLPAAANNDELGVEAFAFLAYEWCRRRDMTQAPFDAWLDTLQSVEPLADDPDPT